MVGCTQIGLDVGYRDKILLDAIRYCQLLAVKLALMDEVYIAGGVRPRNGSRRPYQPRL